MTYPEYLDLFLAILAQVPWPWVMAGIIAGVALSAVIIILAIVAETNEDARRRDVYYEDYVRIIRGLHKGQS